MEDRVEIFEAAVGEALGRGRLSIGHDTTNRMLDGDETDGREVAITSLDAVFGDRSPVLIKIDVEGFEPEVIRGASATLRKPSLKAIIIETVTAEIEEAFETHGFLRVSYEPFNRRLSVLADRKPPCGLGSTLYVKYEGVADLLREAPSRSISGILV